MSNEMISMPRELLREVVECSEIYIDISDSCFEELRALLAKPVAQHQGEPVGWYKPHWNGKSAEWCLGAELTGAVFPEMWEPLYTRPAEQPVGRWYAADDIDALVRELDVLINGEAGAAPQAKLCDIVAQLRRDRPAPAAVVLPEPFCRQKLAAEGKPHPRSGCAVCGQFSPKWRECDAESLWCSFCRARTVGLLDSHDKHHKPDCVVHELKALVRSRP